MVFILNKDTVRAGDWRPPRYYRLLYVIFIIITICIRVPAFLYCLLFVLNNCCINARLIIYYALIVRATFLILNLVRVSRAICSLIVH